MEFQEFVRKPFVVEAVEVTEENIAEIAPLVGKLHKKPDGTSFIQVNQRLVPNVFRVFPGFWMTRLGDNVRCYSKKIFHQQFVQSDASIADWIEYMTTKSAKVSSNDGRVEVTVASTA